MPGSRLSAGVWLRPMRVAVPWSGFTTSVAATARVTMPGSRLSAGVASSMRVARASVQASDGHGYVRASRHAWGAGSRRVWLRPCESPCLGGGLSAGVASSMRVAVPRFRASDGYGYVPRESPCLGAGSRRVCGFVHESRRALEAGSRRSVAANRARVTMPGSRLSAGVASSMRVAVPWSAGFTTSVGCDPRESPCLGAGSRRVWLRP